MKINIDIDDKHEETLITIQANEWSEELEEVISMVKRRKPQRIFGIDEDQTILLQPEDIDFVYAENRKTFASLENRQLEVRLKLYEIEKMLAPHNFMRFSKSVIGNLNHIQRFEVSFNGNLCVYFHSGNKEYITRKYVSAIKDKLMMGGNSNES